MVLQVVRVIANSGIISRQLIVGELSLRFQSIAFGIYLHTPPVELVIAVAQCLGLAVLEATMMVTMTHHHPVDVFLIRTVSAIVFALMASVPLLLLLSLILRETVSILLTPPVGCHWI
ncbi:MAG: hypothetical protein MOB07_15345 [Acidobacteria bacterium]|nr:hypothetical protein [Acidobacteriota bacterium]